MDSEPLSERHAVRGAAQMVELGAALGRLLAPGDVVLLEGQLGAGKTTLVQGIALGIGCAEPVTSPTFDLIHEYRSGRTPLIHIDPYRLQGPDELENIGYCDYLDLPCVLAVEWPERLGYLTPGDPLRITIEVRGRTRHVLVQRPAAMAHRREAP
ncbi:MAG: tRNA (adenosine(37)-N6)-threonylcarbamoyltransferase complex ATPase subunit type 1 TsaE [Armatimonadetes bacterium]|nr:tRNA (adenosine(37)-N6)-threonylcarbamoyltransferase complex ATPase subunit type 1 TsaE [Armatimonadota bacterium]